jgi:hypothetical protein
VNKLVYAAAGGIAVVAVAVFFLLGSGPVFPAGNQDRPQVTVLPPAVLIKDVNATRTGDDTARMLVAFTVKNPNNGTLVLESIHYDVAVDGEQMAIGDWGGVGEGLVAGSDRLTVIVSGTTVTIRDPDATVEERKSSNSEAWDKMVSGDASFVVSGTYAYRVTAALNTIAEEKDFSLTFP